MKFDLHMHSGYSGDGQLTPEELINMAADKGLKVIALSDHDSVQGVEEITALGAEQGIQVIPAIECSTLFYDQPVHVLGYGIDIHNPYLLSLASRLKAMNDGVFHTRIEKMEKKYGIQIDEEEVYHRAKGKNPWFSLIEMMMEMPEIQSHPDFQDYLPGGSRSDPAPVNFYWDRCMPGSDLFVEVPFPDFFDTIQKIHEAGGIAVIAHPFTTFYRREDRLQEAIAGGIDGLEAYSNYHTDEQNQWYEEYARRHNLLITCGSDFHGEKKPKIVMGEYGLKKDGTPFLEDLFCALDHPKTKKSLI